MKKKLVSVALCVALVFALAVPAFAAGNDLVIPPEPEDFGEPIEVITYFDDELNVTVTERIYFVPDEAGISLMSNDGHGWFKREGEINWDGSANTKFYAQGYFIWGEGTVTVTSPSVGHDPLSAYCSVVSSVESHGSGGPTAFVTHTLTVKNWIGGERTREVTIRVDANGNAV